MIVGYLTAAKKTEDRNNIFNTMKKITAHLDIYIQQQCLSDKEDEINTFASKQKLSISH